MHKLQKKIGFSGFDYQNSHEIFIEHAKLSAYQNVELSNRQETDHFRYFNLQGLTTLAFADYDNLIPIQ